MPVVRFYNKEYTPAKRLKYSVIASKFKGQWIFVRHKKRTTWEIAGGHIEKGETADEAAARELGEETGAQEFNLSCIATYSVESDNKIDYGRLYFAEVLKMGDLPDFSEIGEVILRDDIPENLTHPGIQPVLFKKTKEFLENSSS